MKQTFPDYIRDNENLRQILVTQEGFMKYVADYIINGGDDGLSLYAKFQEHVFDEYRNLRDRNIDPIHKGSITKLYY